MERTAREIFTPKRDKRVRSLSSSEIGVGSPHKKPKHYRLSPSAGNHSSTSSEDDNQDKKYAEGLGSIRHAIEALKYTERKFYHEQQKQYEEFHQSQQEQYDGLMRRISDIEWYTSREARAFKQKTKYNNQFENNKNTQLESEGRMMENIDSGGEYINVGGTTGALDSSQTASHKDLAPLPIGMHKTVCEIEFSKGEVGKKSLPQSVPNGKEKQSTRDSNIANEPGKQEHALKLNFPSKSATRRRYNKHRTSNSPTTAICDDLSEGDGGDSSLHKEFRMARSPPSDISQLGGILNEDGALEDIEIESGPTKVEMGEQRHRSSPSLPTLSSGQDQSRTDPVDRSTTVIPNRTRDICARSRHSLREIPRVDYELRLSIGESDEENPSPPIRASKTAAKAVAKTPSTTTSKTPSKTTAMVPTRPKPKKREEAENNDGSDHLNSTKDNTIKKGTPRKRGALKPVAGPGDRCILEFFARSPTKKSVGRGNHHLSSSPTNNVDKRGSALNAQKYIEKPPTDIVSRYKAVRVLPVS